MGEAESVDWGVILKMRKRLSDWIIIILILVFFAIPICSLAVADSVTSWPKCSTSFIYNLFLK